MNCDLCNHELSVPQKFINNLLEIKNNDKDFVLFCSEACCDSINLEIEVLYDVEP